MAALQVRDRDTVTAAEERARADAAEARTRKMEAALAETEEMLAEVEGRAKDAEKFINSYINQ